MCIDCLPVTETGLNPCGCGAVDTRGHDEPSVSQDFLSVQRDFSRGLSSVKECMIPVRVCTTVRYLWRTFKTKLYLRIIS